MSKPAVNRHVYALLVAFALSPGAVADASPQCRSVATAVPTPPASEGLYPARLVRVDGRVADPAPQQEMIKGLRMNDNGGTGVRDVFPASMPRDPAMDSRRSARLEPGPQLLRVVEHIPDDALSSTAVTLRRRAGTPPPKQLLIEVEPGREYAIAARLLPEQANRTLANAHWEPVVWREQALACR